MPNLLLLLLLLLLYIYIKKLQSKPFWSQTRIQSKQCGKQRGYILISEGVAKVGD